MLFNLILDEGPNRGYVSGDQCWLNGIYVVSYCCFREHVEDHFKNFGKPLGSKGNNLRTPKFKKTISISNNISMW
jgi:hypothetical protein